MLPRFLRSWVTLAALQLGSMVPTKFGLDRPSDYKRFQLHASGKPLDFVVEGLADDAEAIGLTEDRLRVAVESRPLQFETRVPHFQRHGHAEQVRFLQHRPHRSPPCSR